MTRVLICGAGQIGVSTAAMLSEYPDFQIFMADNRYHDEEVNEWLKQQSSVRTIAIDVKDTASLTDYCRQNQIELIISTLLGEENTPMIETAIACETHYIDCSPKVMHWDAYDEAMRKIGKRMIPNCGLAPGWTGLMAHHCMKKLDNNIQSQIQVGVIADELSHAWSGSAKRFVHEFTEQADFIDQGKPAQMTPLQDVWFVNGESQSFEATHAANGHGHLLSLWQGKVSHLSYQALLPLGVADKVQFLIQSLRLHEQPAKMRQWLSVMFPRHLNSALWVRISVEGQYQGSKEKYGFEQVIHPASIRGRPLSALQLATAVGICSVVDLMTNDEQEQNGLIYQETLDFQQWRSNRFTRQLFNDDCFSNLEKKECDYSAEY